MKSLHSLIRLHKWKIDEARRRVSELYAEQANVERLSRDLEMSIQTEQALAGRTADGIAAYAAYTVAIERQRLLLWTQRQTLAREISEAQAAVAQAYRVLKKYDIVSERAARQEKAEREKRLQAEFDEIAVSRHKF